MVTREALRRLVDPRFAPYDPADSPGPIPSVVDRFRPRPDDPAEPERPGVEAELARYAVVLVPPDTAEELGYHRTDPGLKLYVDGEYDGDLAFLADATKTIEDECGVPVVLVEHHADLYYWTAHPHQQAPTQPMP